MGGNQPVGFHLVGFHLDNIDGPYGIWGDLGVWAIVEKLDNENLKMDKNNKKGSNLNTYFKILYQLCIYYVPNYVTM